MQEGPKTNNGNRRAESLEMATQSRWRTKSVFTTGEVAEICKISQQTVIRCFDDGRLKGFRVPGSKFRRVPRAELIAFMKSNQIPIESLDTGKRRVLIIDDDREISELLVDILGRDNRFEVKAVSNGFDAGAMSKEFKPDILLLDYMLPDINGTVVCERVRNDPYLAHTKIIIISGAASAAEIEKFKQAGADDFIKKPFDLNKLVDRMVELLGL